MQAFSPATLERYEKVLELFASVTATSRLEDIGPDKVRAFFFEGRTGRNWSAETFRTYLKTLSVFFKWCMREGLRTDNPIRGLEVPRVPRSLPAKLTKQSAQRLLEVAHNYPYPTRFLRMRNHAILATFLYCGLRKKELLHLQLADVDVASLSLFVRQGKGAKDRIVPLSQSLAHILRTYMEERQRLGRTCPEFFASSTNNMGVSDSGLRRLIAEIRDASGIRFSAHRLRHTFATLMLEGGCDIYSLSRMLGHSDISTTTIYLSASAEHLRAQMVKHPLNAL